MTRKVDKEEAMVTQVGLLSMQVCVPKGWSNEEISRFARMAVPCGTSNGWQMRKQEEYATPDQERVPCSERTNFVHVLFDA